MAVDLRSIFGKNQTIKDKTMVALTAIWKLSINISLFSHISWFCWKNAHVKNFLGTGALVKSFFTPIPSSYFMNLEPVQQILHFSGWWGFFPVIAYFKRPLFEKN